MAPLRTLAQTTAPEVAAPSAATTAAATAGSAAPQAAPLPKEWSDAIGSLAQKIKAALGDSRALTLEFQNISSLSDADAAAIESAFRTALLGERLELRATADETAAKVRVTFSENMTAFIWVAQIDAGSGAGGENPAVIISVRRLQEQFEGRTRQHVALDKRLIWEQGGKFLDVAAIDKPAGSPSYRVVLEPHKLVFYESADSRWNVVNETVAFQQVTKWLRTASGVIDVNAKDAWVWDGDPAKHELPSVRCVGDFGSPSSVQCMSWNQRPTGEFEKSREIPGLEDRASLEISQPCGAGSIALSTGDGDWTQPDAIQGYIVSGPGGAIAPSGDPMPMDGPVLDLIPQGQGNAARAIVRNLATGNYEAYAVTATCSE